MTLPPDTLDPEARARQQAAAGASAVRRILVVFNPAAGRNPQPRLKRILVALDQLGCAVALRETTMPGEATIIARSARAGDFDLVVAAGGDGTVNEVVNGLSGGGLPLAVLPLGTGNVLANEIGLPRRATALAQLLAFGRAKPVWPAEIEGRRFLMMAGAGFDARVLQRLDERVKQRFGKLAYVIAITRAVAGLRPERFRVTVDGIAHDAASVVVAKGHYYAGRFVLAPEAEIAEPRLWVVLFRRGGRLAAVRYLVAMALGLVPSLKDVTVIEGRECLIEGPEGAAVEADGDLVGTLPVRIGIAAAPLEVIQPQRG